MFKTRLSFGCRISLSIMLLFLVGSPITASEVVINEIFYNAPDDVSDLEWVELHNTSDQAIDISGWSFSEGIGFQFPQGTRIGPRGYLVVAKDKRLFAEFYRAPVIGDFSQSLSDRGESLQLSDAKGKEVDRVRYRDRSPWPTAADGYSASLERICPQAESNSPHNWVASTMPTDEMEPAGTPGARNGGYRPKLPPIVSQLAASPSAPTPDQAIHVTASIKSTRPMQSVELLYRLVKPGAVGPEVSVTMKESENGLYAADVPGQAAGSLIRYRVRATDGKGLTRIYPAETALRPAYSIYVKQKLKAAKIPFVFLIHTRPQDVRGAERRWKDSFRRRGFGRRAANPLVQLEAGLDLSDAWFQVTLEQDLDLKTVKKLREVFLKRQTAAAALKRSIFDGENGNASTNVRDRVRDFQQASTEAIVEALPKEAGQRFQASREQRSGAGRRAGLTKRLLRLEPLWLALAMRFELTDDHGAKLLAIFKQAAKERKETESLFQNIRDRGGFEKARSALGKVEQRFQESLQPALSFRQRRFVNSWQQRQGSPIRPREEVPQAVPPRGRSAFVFVDAKSQQVQVFDFVHVSPRSAGYKIRLHKDHPLRDMTTFNIIFEYNDRFVLAEPLAFEVYRRAGNAASQTDFARLWIDGRLQGYHLLFEQPNRAFLRRNKLKADGNLYKLIWYGQTLAGQHEKKTNPDGDHGDLIDVTSQLKATRGEERWKVIEKHFNVPQVVNYFAVNTCLSHWDGFFNNYFAYHDKGGKWEMYPWDQDKTWGFYDRIPRDTVFFDMPITFGMDGDQAPGGGRVTNFRSWWRPGGHFSGPLLANPTFRKQFLKRTRQILEEVYSEEKFFPTIDAMAERLRDEIPIRAKAIQEPPERAIARFNANIESLKRHLIKRREFLLKQDELQSINSETPRK